LAKFSLHKKSHLKGRLNKSISQLFLTHENGYPMIEIVDEFKRQNTTDGDAGNLNNFLQALIIEVAAENYRQALAEGLLLQKIFSRQSMDIALRANEKVVSGLFSNALGKVCTLVRPEVRTDRGGSAGRLDFLAWYNNRVIAIELKAGAIRLNKTSARVDIKKRWNRAKKQIEMAQTSFRNSHDDRFNKPISLALMIISGTTGRNIDEADWSIDSESEQKDLFLKALKSFKPKPQFSAIYSIPSELRRPVRLRSGIAIPDRQTYTPFFGFIARARVHGARN
jgi:hypothetical protein